MIEVGQRLPEVLGIDQDGKEWKISDFKGKKLVLYLSEGLYSGLY